MRGRPLVARLELRCSGQVLSRRVGDVRCDSSALAARRELVVSLLNVFAAIIAAGVAAHQHIRNQIASLRHESWKNRHGEPA
jgi:hypothetical protein